MFFDSVLLMMEIQRKSISMMGDLMIAYGGMYCAGVACAVEMFYPREISLPAAMNPVIRRDDMMSAIESAENEGMGTAIASAQASAAVDVKPADYHASCNIDAQVPAPESVVEEKRQGIKKWFSENAVACEQDIFDDRLPYRRVYTGMGQTPNAPSALAVLERHRARNFKIHAA